MREIRTLRSMWRGLETWLDRNTSIEVGAPGLDPTEDTALQCWQTCGPGGQARYSDAAIQTSLMVRTAFKLPLRQAEGLMTSVLTLRSADVETRNTPKPLIRDIWYGGGGSDTSRGSRAGWPDRNRPKITLRT